MAKHRIIVMLLAGMLAVPVVAAPSAGTTLPPDKPPRPPRGHEATPPHDPGRRFRSGPGMWMVFSRLTPEERQAMMKLQREDPEKFREVMSAKADELYKKRQQRRAELHRLAEQCRNAAAPEEKERLKKKLTEELRKDFIEHLKANRTQIEDMKRRTEFLEKELQRREKNMDKAVNAIVEALIKGEKPPIGPNSRRFHRERLEK